MDVIFFNNIYFTDEYDLNITNNSASKRSSLMQLSVTGKLRPEPVRIPAYLGSGKPNPSVNKKVGYFTTKNTFPEHNQILLIFMSCF